MSNSMRRYTIAFILLLSLAGGNWVKGITALCATALEEATPLSVPAGFRAKPGTTPEPYSNTGWAKEIIHEKTGIELVFIPAGKFQMGSRLDEPGRFNDEGPVHTVVIAKPFYIGKYEVTQEQWEKVMENNPSFFKGINPRFPVETVSWNDCNEFLQKAGDGLRLPTEAEWEYACRAGTRTRFYFGDDEAALGDYAWYIDNSGPRTHPVGQKRPNAWELYDIHGNVWEWCRDQYYDSYAPSATAGSLKTTEDLSGRILRGGSAWSSARNCRSAVRYWYGPSEKSIEFGFRVARGLE